MRGQSNAAVSGGCAAIGRVEIRGQTRVSRNVRRCGLGVRSLAKEIAALRALVQRGPGRAGGEQTRALHAQQARVIVLVEREQAADP